MRGASASPTGPPTPLSVTDPERQQAAEAFRQRHGLTTPPDTHAWLARDGLTMADFQAVVLHLTIPAEESFAR